MARTKRADEAASVYHMLNRVYRRATVFIKEADFEAFEHILVEALERVKLKIFAYCILSNHWHLVISPEIEGETG